MRRTKVHNKSETTSDQGLVGRVETGPADRNEGVPVGGPIVVGVDGSARSLTALQWAVQEARLRKCSVRVVMAWQPVQVYGETLGLGPTPAAEGLLASAAAAEVARLAEQTRSADVPMTWEAVVGHPAWALVAAAQDAELLVVGSRGHGGFVGMMLGSVSQHVLSHARCPVVLVPDLQRRDHRHAS
jgi:nucleotide-binding universal stress UspA family protein